MDRRDKARARITHYQKRLEEVLNYLHSLLTAQEFATQRRDTELLLSISAEISLTITRVDEYQRTLRAWEHIITEDDVHIEHARHEALIASARKRQQNNTRLLKATLDTMQSEIKHRAPIPSTAHATQRPARYIDTKV